MDDGGDGDLPDGGSLPRAGRVPAESVVRGSDDDLFRALYPGLRRFAAVTAPLDLDPDDLLQEAVARALRAGPLHRLEHPAAYLRRTIVHLAANHNRSRGRERRARERLGAPESTAGGVYPSDLADLEHLEPADRAVVYLADVERLPLADIAVVLGVSGPALRARVSRARRRLRRAVAPGSGTETEGGMS